MAQEPHTIDLYINGSRATVEQPDLGSLVASLGVTGRFAVERNGELVPRSHLGATRLTEGDRIEIVRAIGGG